MRLLRSLIPSLTLVLAFSQLVLSDEAADREAADRETEDRKAEDRKAELYRKKYFHEPGGSDELGHYDARYFKGSVAYEEHRKTLLHLIRSYLSTFDRLGIETWIAHGTLLGWWWNGRIMPWDYDLDVQVSTATLYWLGKNMNRTEHSYTYEEDVVVEDQGQLRSQTVMRNKTYMLDVNPHHIELTREDGMNIIDARWIDTSNGMFVDITGLAERDPDNQPGVWSCKNYHMYKTTDLWPMRVSEFEGVTATVPYSFEKILIEEYGSKSLVTTEWLGHRWEPDQKVWVKMPGKKDDKWKA